MDPISVAASLLGLLGAAAKVSEVLTNFIKAVKDAPKLARRVFSEVEDLALCFQRILDFVSSEANVDRSRAAMITVDQLLIVLTNCVTTFSELENALGGLTSKTFSVNLRLKWITKEHTIAKILQRLLSSKTSLNLILTTLNCTRMQEAQKAIQSLAHIVSDVLANSQNIGRRLEDMNLPTALRHRSAPSALELMAPSYEDLSFNDPHRNSYASSATTTVEERTPRTSTFEQDLRISRVYSRASSLARRQSIQGLLPLPSSSAGDSIQSSTLSSLSLADVPDLSLLSLPVSVSTLWNSQRYTRQTPANLVQKDLDCRFFTRSRPTAKVLLLGTANAGKSTVLKQLQMMRGREFTQAEIVKARHVIYSNLLKVFDHILRSHPTLSAMAKSLCEDAYADGLPENVGSSGNTLGHPILRFAIGV
ncbi:MAG: hypothetical protein Q9203_007365 [Teloschistes exilis]